MKLAELRSKKRDQFKPYNFQEQEFGRLSALLMIGGFIISPLFCFFIKAANIPQVYFEFCFMNILFLPSLVCSAYFLKNLRNKIMNIFLVYLFGITIYIYIDMFRFEYDQTHLFCFLAFFCSVIYIIQRILETFIFSLLVLSLLIGGWLISDINISWAYFGIFFLISFIVLIVLISRSRMIDGVEAYSHYLKRVVNNPGIGYILLQLTSSESIVLDSNEEMKRIFTVPSDKLGEHLMCLLKDRPETIKKIHNLKIDESVIESIQVNENQYIEFQFSLITLKNGAYTFVRVTDISERIRESQQLVYREAKYRSLFEFSNDIILLVDDGIIIDYNQNGKQVLGLTNETGIKLKNFFSSNYSEEIRNNWFNQLHEYGVVEFTSKIKGVNGWFDAVVLLTKIQLGDVYYLQCVIHDLTIEKTLSKEQLRAELAEETNKLLEQEIRVRKIAERKLADQYLRNNAIFESSSNTFLMTVDTANVVSSFNTHAKFYVEQLTAKEAEIGSALYDFMGRFVSQLEYRFFRRLLTQVFKGETKEMEVSFGLEDKQQCLHIFITPIINLDQVVSEVSLVAHDITSKKQNEIKLISSLKEKEILLKEVHHRVKNNLQIISSILNLQSSFITDEHMVNVLQESRNRIHSMAIIHENLYRTDNFSSINFTNYLKNLLSNLLTSYPLTGKLNLIQYLTFVELSLDQSVPLGLLVNELFTNAIKYAFPDNRNGTITVKLEQTGSTITLIIQDDGIGLPPDMDIENSNTLGLQLVSTLVFQLDGKLSYKSENGTEFLITFEKT
jgi:PAS domain S-box-containing protein